MRRADLSPAERLASLKADAADFDYPDDFCNKDDVLWLIAEVERLKALVTEAYPVMAAIARAADRDGESQ